MSKELPKDKTRELRNSLAQFATGVTVITCLDSNGQPIGVTANSFSSLSLDPPLVLWSIATKSSSRPAFESFGYFAVNILTDSQQVLAMVFSKPSENRFATVSTVSGIQGLPLINNCLAQFECKVTQTLEQGDHILMIGEVLAFRQPEASRPLLFSQGRFAQLADLSANDLNVASDDQNATFYQDYLPYLLARAANDATGHFHGRLKHFGLTMLSWRVLACLSDGLAWTVNDLSRVSLAKQPTVSKLLDRLEAQRLIKRKNDELDARKVMVTLTKTGAQKIAPVINEAKSYSESLAKQFEDGELGRLKVMLRGLIN